MAERNKALDPAHLVGLACPETTQSIQLQSVERAIATSLRAPLRDIQISQRPVLMYVVLGNEYLIQSRTSSERSLCTPHSAHA